MTAALRNTLAFAAAIVLVATAAPAAEGPPEGYSLAGALSAPVSSGIGDAAGGGHNAGATGSDTLRSVAHYQNKWPGPVLRTVFDIIVVNEVIWAYNRYIREGGENPEFRKGWNSLVDNLKNGFEWDDNNFSTNHFLHPYHGSLYFTGARSNGLSFWGAIPLTFMGSFGWEYFGEINNPSINDWINTSMGGMALGEGLFRLSNMVLDNTDTGGSRTWREIGGFLVAPVRGLNRLITGEAFEVHANPADRYPDHLSARLDLGGRTIGQDHFWRENSTKVFLRFAADYGDVFEEVGGDPFDQFDFQFQLNFDNPGHAIGRIQARGLLYGQTVSESDNAQHVLGAQQHFDYYDNEAYTFGNQSFSASFFSKILNQHGFEARTVIHANAVVMGAAKSDYFSVSGREYDYGPGLGFKLGASFGRDGRQWLSLAHEEFWIHSINGTRADHYVNFTGVTAAVPLRGFFGLKFDYLLYLSESRYQNFPDVSQRSPEIRAYFSWNVD